MTVRLLFFSGSWANQSNFFLLETEKDILVLAVGKAFLTTETQEQQVGQDYLKENKAKVRAIIILNTNWQNVGLLPEICQTVETNIPLYASYLSKLTLASLFPSLRNKVIVVEKNQPIKVGDIVFSGLPLSGYLIGNLGLVVHFAQLSLYFLEGLIFSTLLNNKLLSPPHFLTDFSKFLSPRRKYSYLITSLQGLHWKSHNSLFWATNYFPTTEETYFFVLYDYDWLHILELLEIASQRKQKVCFWNEKFASLINQVLGKDPLCQVIQTKKGKETPSTIYLLTGNPENIENDLRQCLSSFSLAQRTNFHFVVGIPPVIGGMKTLAQIVDYLHTQSEKVTNLSKKEYLNLGINFNDFKLLLNWLQPTGIITYQNSYKNTKFFLHLPGKFFPLQNGYTFDFSTRRSVLLKPKKFLINLEELLIKQRENLSEEGALIVLLVAERKESGINLKKVRVENLAISQTIEVSKLESKIKNWWTSKIAPEIIKSDSSEKIKKVVKAKLGRLVSNYLNFENEIEIEEPLILLFIV